MADETLEWDLKVDADTSGGTRMDAVLGRLDQTIGTLNQHLERVHGATERAGSGHKKHADHAGGLTGAFQRLIHQGLEPFLHKAKEIAEFEFIREGTQKLLELPGELAEKVKELGEELLHAAASQERFGIAFKNSLGEEAAEATLGYIEKIGHHTEFTQHELKNMNLELAKSGLRGGDLARANEAVIDLASMSANPQAGADAAVGALRRLMTTGKIEGRALRPFGISTKDFFTELSKETGTGVETLKKQMTKGKVDVDTSLNSLYTVITNKTGKALGGAGADMEKTFNVRLKNLKEIPELLGEKLAGSKGYAAISNFIGKMADAFSPDSELGKKIYAGLESIVDTIGEQLEGIDLKEVATTITDDLIPAVKSLAGHIGAAAEATMRVVRGFSKIASFFGEANDAFDESVAQSLGTHSMKTFDQITKDLGPASLYMKGKGLGSLAPGTKKGATEEFTTVGEGMGAAVEKGFRKKTRTHSPSELFAEIGGDVAAGFAMGIDDSTDRVARSFDRMMAPASLGGPGAGGGGAVGPEVRIVVQQTNHITGGGDIEHIPDDIAEKLVEIVPGAVQSALEQMARQTGSTR